MIVQAPFAWPPAGQLLADTSGGSWDHPSASNMVPLGDFGATQTCIGQNILSDPALGSTLLG